MVPKLPDRIPQMMAGRDWRIHHYLWHEVRNGWLAFDNNTQAAIRDLGWEPPRPARNKPDADGKSLPILDNNSGEDFLYMHRQMIASVNSELAKIADPQYPRVQGWPSVPLPHDADYFVPPPWQRGDAGLDDYLRSVKSEEVFKSSFVPWEADYKNPKKLASWTLGELGARIEFTIHNQMHMRWCSEPVNTGIRPDIDVADPNKIDPKWDDASYDWLGDTYSSHVNSVFWKIHGWVDNRIEGWKAANNVTGDISWKGKWVGKEMKESAPRSFLAVFSEVVGHDHHGGSNGTLAEMEKLVAVLAHAGRFCHFYDDIILPEP